MTPEILTQLLTPSPILYWLLMTLPLTIALAGCFGALEHETGNRRMMILALALLIWLFLPFRFEDPILAQISVAVSILGWCGLVNHWARHIWINRPTPVWTHALVCSQLLAIVLACGLAVVRAFAGSATQAV